MPQASRGPTLWVGGIGRLPLKRSIEDTRRIEDPLHVLPDGRLLDGYGRLELGHVRINTKNDVASEAIRRYHEQSLDNAKTVLRTVAVDQREISSSTFGIDPKDMPEAKEMLRRFRKRFARSLEKQKGKQIYQLEVAFFPITRAS